MTVQSGRHQAAHAAGGRKASRGRDSETRTEPSAPEFVGRDDALAAVLNALEHGPALVLVEGEAGIGKTRLVREALTAFKSDASAGDRTSGRHRVLVAPCPALEEPFPLGAVVDGVRRLRPDVAELNLSPLGGALRPLFPEWPDDLPPALEPLDDPKETRHRVFAALTELVERLEVDILIVEDAHWADTATLEWLLTLTAAEPGHRATSIVVTYRPTDVPRGSLLVRLASRAPAGMRQLRVELEPLGIVETQRLVGSMVGADEVSEEFASFLHERTDGVPLAVEECVRLLRDRQDIVHRRGRWNRRVLDELDVPPTVRDSVLERVDRLDPGARRVLEAAAVLAAPADESLLTAVAGLDDQQAGRHAVAAALNSGLLQETDPGRFVFRHVLDAEAVGEAIAVSERRRLHGRAAEALQQRDPEPVVRLARHFREAGETNAWCRYAEAAADLAWESGDDRAAVMTLLDVLTEVDHPVERRVRLARRLGRTAAGGRAALGGLAERVTRALRAVLAGEDVPARDRGEIRLQLGRLLLQLAEFDVVYEEIEAAVADLGHRPALAAKAMISLALPRGPWPVSRHLHWMERATELFPQVRSPAELTDLLADRAVILLMLGEQAGWSAVNEVPREAATLEEQRQITRFHLNVGHMAVAWGRYGEARQGLQTAIEWVHSNNYLRVLNNARSTQARLDWYVGAWQGLADKAQAVSDADDTLPEARIETSEILALLELVDGHRGAAERQLRGLLAEAEQQGIVDAQVIPAATLGRVYLTDGSIDSALEVTANAMDTIVRKGLWLWATDIAPVRIEALAAAGADAEVDVLLSGFASWLSSRDAPAPAAALATCRAIVAEAHRDPTEAARLYVDAADAWATLPRPYDELQARERQGRCLLAAGERDEALAVLSDTEQRLQGLGAKWDADRVAQVLRRHGVEVVRTWRRGPRGYGDQLSPRELEVVSLVARGMTNKQAAEVLFVSPKTVATQLSAAMRKLGVSSRTAVAMAAAEAGLLSPDDNSQEMG